MVTIKGIDMRQQKVVYFAGVLLAIIGGVLITLPIHIVISTLMTKGKMMTLFDLLNLYINVVAFLVAGFTILVAGASYIWVTKDPINYFREIRSRNVTKFSRYYIYIIAPPIGWSFLFFLLSVYPRWGFSLDSYSIEILLFSAFVFFGHLPVIFHYKKKVESHRRRIE